MPRQFPIKSKMEQVEVDIKVDVSVLKEKVSTLTDLCNKMDRVIEKLTDNQTALANQIYNDMDKRKEDTVSDIKELHSRITTVDRNLSDKIELTERRIMDEIKSLREHITAHNDKEDEDIKKLSQWKWMVAGGVVVLAWIISNIKLDQLVKLFN
jgi:predicted RNase H-like nuclease (RuvC/YqgF family)